MKTPSTWQINNLANIKQRLTHHRETENLAQIIPSKLQGVFVRTVDDVMELYCYDPHTRDLSDIMSRVSLSNPLDLIATYTQVMFLGYVWQKTPPKRAYIAGFGGGRLAMATHHYNPAALVDGSDFDPAIIDIATTHFGIRYDERYSVKAADSFEDLESREATYDFVVVDVFSNAGEHVSHLASKEFFEMCKSKLSTEGVVVVNLLERDEDRPLKIANLHSVFPHLIEWRDQGSHIIFASSQNISIDEIVARSKIFEQQAALNFTYSEHALNLKIVDYQSYKTA